MKYIVIVEQDESIYRDKTGLEYHFPNSKYLKRISEGDRVIYYKGRLKSSNEKIKKSRLSKEPHYFGIGTVDKITPDKELTNHSVAIIKDYVRFPKAVPFKIKGAYVEETFGYSNHFMGGNSVREQPKEVFDKILKLAEIDISDLSQSEYNDYNQGESGSLESYWEGNKKKVFTTVFERNSQLRERAVAIHGLSCVVCSFNFEEKFGDWGAGFIHIHHLNPISDGKGTQKEVNPSTDLVPVCPNCHAMIHRKKSKTLDIEELKAIYND